MKTHCGERTDFNIFSILRDNIYSTLTGVTSLISAYLLIIILFLFFFFTRCRTRVIILHYSARYLYVYIYTPTRLVEIFTPPK